jgi:hypothetical protein
MEQDIIQAIDSMKNIAARCSSVPSLCAKTHRTPRIWVDHINVSR